MLLFLGVFFDMFRGRFFNKAQSGHRHPSRREVFPIKFPKSQRWEERACVGGGLSEVGGHAAELELVFHFEDGIAALEVGEVEVVLGGFDVLVPAEFADDEEFGF